MGKAAAGIRGTPTTRTAAARSPLRIDCGWWDNRSERYLAPLAPDLRRTRIHDSAVRPPAALNAGFAPHCCRSDARGLTSQIDPKLPYTTASTNGGAGVGLRTFVRPCLIPHSGANGSGVNASVCTEKLLSVFGPKVVVMAHPRHRDRRPSESGRCEGYCCAHQRRTVRHHIA